MYSTTSESLNYIRRVASHSTKPRRTGRIDDIPSWAEKPEANSIIEEYRVLIEAPDLWKRGNYETKKIFRKMKQLIGRRQSLDRRRATMSEGTYLRLRATRITNQEHLELQWLELKLAELGEART